MKHAPHSVGDWVVFETNTGQKIAGRIIHVILERKQPHLLLIERPEDGWRVYRLPEDVSPHEPPEMTWKAAGA